MEIFFFFLVSLFFFFVFFGFFGFWFRSSALPSPSNLRQIRELKLQLILLNFLWDQKKHLQGTGASIFSQVNYISLFIFVVDKNLSKNSCRTHATTVLSETVRPPKLKTLSLKTNAQALLSPPETQRPCFSVERTDLLESGCQTLKARCQALHGLAHLQVAQLFRRLYGFIGIM